jgi:hypothetical protein
MTRLTWTTKKKSSRGKVKNIDDFTDYLIQTLIEVNQHRLANGQPQETWFEADWQDIAEAWGNPDMKYPSSLDERIKNHIYPLTAAGKLLMQRQGDKIMVGVFSLSQIDLDTGQLSAYDIENDPEGLEDHPMFEEDGGMKAHVKSCLDKHDHWRERKTRSNKAYSQSRRKASSG